MRGRTPRAAPWRSRRPVARRSLVRIAWSCVCWPLGRPPSGSAATRGGCTARIFGIQIDYEHFPPFNWPIAADLALPHVWIIAAAFL